MLSRPPEETLKPRGVPSWRGGPPWSTGFSARSRLRSTARRRDEGPEAARSARVAPPARQRRRARRAADRRALGRERAATAANTLQVYVSQLRKLVGDAWSRDGAGYSLRVEPDELDAARFERLAGEAAAALGRSELRRGSRACRRGAGARGAGPRSSTFSTSRSHSRRSCGSRSCGWPRSRTGSRRRSASAATTRSIGELEALVAEHPVRERFRALAHARALSSGAAGRRARDVPRGAAGAARRARARARPRPARARAGDPAPGRGALPAAAAGGQRPAAGQHARRARPRAGGDLRRAARRRDAAADADRPGRSRARHGLRSRRRTRSAGELPDGAFFVPLDTIRDPALLLPAIAQALGVRESGEQPLLESLAERRLRAACARAARQLRAAGARRLRC